MARTKSGLPRNKNVDVERCENGLTLFEQKYLNSYLKEHNMIDAYRAIITDEENAELTDNACRLRARRIMLRPHFKAELERIQAIIKEETVATAKEVLEYFTSVMRGEIKDQFGLDPSLADRTKAAQELAKRTIDRALADEKAKANSNTTIEVKLDWGRD